MKRVVVVGGGFGGLNVVRGLGRVPGVEVLLIDRRNHHLFQPLLYQVAMAGLSPADIAFPIRSIFRKFPRVRVLMGEAKAVRQHLREIETSVGTFAYDFLVLACGAEHSYFGHTDWEDFAPGLKTLEQATEIRRRVLTAFERAESESNARQVEKWLTFAIVGGGPTGVELAGALSEITRHTLARDFRHIDPSRARVVLIEAGPRLLASFPPSLSERAQRDLRTMGVEVVTGVRVTRVDGDGVLVGDRLLAAGTAIWAAGVRPSPLSQSLTAPLDNIGRVKVGTDLSLPEYPEIFVIGDQAHVDGGRGSPLPGLAPVAMQQGRFVARQIARDNRGLKRESFHYVDKGQMATIGRRRAIAALGTLRFTGVFAWLLWLLIHIYYLIGFRNRMLVLWNWTYSYLTYRRGARLITERDWHLTGGP